MGQLTSSIKPPTKITFHQNHGKDTVLGDESAAVRIENHANCSNGLLFSSEPIKVNQKIYFKLVVVSRSSHDVISIGFTSNDPKDFTNNNSNHEQQEMCALSRYFCSEDSVICFYVNSAGTLHFGKNNIQHKVFGKKFDINKPLWAVFYIWSEPTTIRLIGQQEAKQNVFHQNEAKKMDFVVDNKIKSDIGTLTDENDYSGCIICCSRDIEVVFVVCGHFCCCFDCGLAIRNKDNLCPICRKVIQSVVRVYRS